MKLIYINKVGKNWEDEYIYEFIFSNNIEDVDSLQGEDWDTYPAAGSPTPPSNKSMITNVGVLRSQIKFDVIQDSTSFAFWDAIDGLIALGWEDINGYDEYPDKRLFFTYGEDISIIDNKLYERDLVLTYSKKLEKVK